MERVIILLHSYLLVFVTLLNGDDRKRAVFKEVSHATSLEDGTMTNMFHKSFHQCSIEGRCSFVIENLNKNEFKKVYSENDLPRDRKAFRVWQKHQSLLADVQEVQKFIASKKLMRASSIPARDQVTPNVTGKFAFKRLVMK